MLCLLSFDAGKFDAPTDDCQRGDCSWSVGAGGEILIEWGEVLYLALHSSADLTALSAWCVLAGWQAFGAHQLRSAIDQWLPCEGQREVRCDF